MPRLWNRKGELLQTLEGHRKRIWNASFSPVGDSLPSGIGQTIVTPSVDGTGDVPTLTLRFQM